MFTAHDRCDQCGAQALARVVRTVVPATLEEVEFTPPKLQELLFCGHHMNKHAEALTAQGFTVKARQNVET
jgi:hypothetical protein